MNWENNLWGRSKQTDALGASLAALQADLENTLELYDKRFLQLEAENEGLRECLRSARGYLDPSPIIQGKIDALLKESE